MWMKIVVFSLIVFIGGGVILWDISHTSLSSLSEAVSDDGIIIEVVDTEKTKKTTGLPRLPEGEGHRLPAFTLPLLGGAHVDAASFKRPVVLLHFWASWCAPCIVEFPDLLKLAAKYEDQVDLVLISIDTQEQAIAAFQKRLRRSNPNLNLNAANVYWGHDARKDISLDLFATSKVPETLLVDEKRVIRMKKFGEVDWMSPDIDAILHEILAN